MKHKKIVLTISSVIVTLAAYALQHFGVIDDETLRKTVEVIDQTTDVFTVE